MFVTGKHFQYLAAHKVANRLGSKEVQLSQCFMLLLAVIHAVSSFVVYGNKTAWSIWNTLPQFTDALWRLSCAPSKVPEDVMVIIFRFVILLYNSNSIHAQI